MRFDERRRDVHVPIESTVNECLQYALGAETYQDTFDRLLSFTGKFFQCARVYIFELNKNDTFSNTYEWCAPGNEPQLELLQNEPLETIEWWMTTFQENRQVIEHFVVSLLKRRDLSYRLTYVSYHDQLTGALNRSAFKEKEKELQGNICTGILYGDITGLKRENDLFGHDAGERLICRCYEMLQKEFQGELIYRMGGDEFMVICVDMERQEFEEKCFGLREIISKEDNHLSTGSSWGCLEEKSLHTLVNEAEEEMYRNKKEYYSGGIRKESRGGEARWISKYPSEAKTMLEFFMKNPESIGTLIESTEMLDSPICLYVGDLRTNVFYITDTMRKMFGFDGNVVYDLLTKWEKRICHSEDLESYREDMKNIWENDGKEHDFKYRVYDKDGKMLWIHCMGMLCRDEAGTPTYFAGFVSRQEFLIDPVTNFPREKGAINKLETIRDKGMSTIVFGIGLNHFTEINEMKGREVADRLLQEITIYWDNKLSNHVWFYRMDGVAFMAVVKPECVELVDNLVEELRESVRYYFRKWHIQVKNPCCFCKFHYPLDIGEPEEFLEKVITFIEVVKSYSENECVSYSAKTIEKYRESAELMLCLNEDVLNGCKSLGMSIALDDFGSGYSSMGLLIKYPSNVVKLDRSLLNDLIDSRDRQTFLKTIISACHQLGKLVCTEGVEGSEEARIVRETGSDMIQGYHFYRPLELADFYGILNEK